jgi:hypothetical protein
MTDEHEHEHEGRTCGIDRQIDRLVDGELPEAERRVLLARLDRERESDGWRRCALAFLEAQAWGEALRPPGAGASATAPTVLTVAAAIAPEGDAGHKRALPGAGRRLAIAAGLLAAFATGWVVRGERAGAPVTRASPSPSGGGPGAVAVETDAATARDTPGPSAGVVRAAAPTPPPDPLVRRLEHGGYQVQRRRRVVSMETRDGRNWSVPVSEMLIQYVGDRTY